MRSPALRRVLWMLAAAALALALIAVLAGCSGWLADLADPDVSQHDCDEDGPGWRTGECGEAPAESEAVVSEAGFEGSEPSALSYTTQEVIDAMLARMEVRERAAAFAPSTLGEIPGVGLPGVPPTFDKHAFPQSSWRGHYGELEGVSISSLAAACRADEWGTAGTHDCIPTVPEVDYVIVHFDRHGAFFRRFWHEQSPGGTPERPEIVSLTTWWGQSERRASAKREDVERYGGRWALGLVGYPGFWGRPRWTSWVRNDLPCEHVVNSDLVECGGIEPPPPPPPPPPGDECSPAGRFLGVPGWSEARIPTPDGGLIRMPPAGLTSTEYAVLSGVRAGNRVGGPFAEAEIRKLARCGVLLPGTRAELYDRSAAPTDTLDVCETLPRAPTLWEMIPAVESTGRLSVYVRSECPWRQE